MTTTVKAMTARRPHACDSCSSTPNVRPIAVGHRYLRHVAFPGDLLNQTARPLTSVECVACASERECSDGLLVAGACATWCCGDVPCARPFKHAGDHSCRRCATAIRVGA
jgi:hypothetical protein